MPATHREGRSSGLLGARVWDASMDGLWRPTALYCYKRPMMHVTILGTAIVGVSLALSGCSGTMAADKHASFYHCDSGQVTSEELPSTGHTKLKTTGCGHEEVFYCIGAKCRSPRILAIRLFAGDHACTDDQTTATAEGEDGMVWLASGCDKSQKYRCKEVPREVIQCDPVQ